MPIDTGSCADRAERTMVLAASNGGAGAGAAAAFAFTGSNTPFWLPFVAVTAILACIRAHIASNRMDGRGAHRYGWGPRRK